jgi:hypothetical protein
MQYQKLNPHPTRLFKADIGLKQYLRPFFPQKLKDNKGSTFLAILAFKVL